MSCEMRNGFRSGSFVGTQSKTAIGSKLARKKLYRDPNISEYEASRNFGWELFDDVSFLYKDARRRDAVFTNRAPYWHN